MSTLFTKQKTDQQDRRQLIKYLLENFQQQGGRVLYPESFQEEVFCDSVDISSFLHTIKTEKFVDLSQWLTHGDEPGISSEYSNKDPNNPENCVKKELSLGKVPSLDLDLDLEDYELQQLAFLIFGIYGIEDLDSTLLTCLRRQLELSAGYAGDIINIIKKIKPRAEQTKVIGLDLLILILQEARPTDFRKFKEFVNWRDSITRVFITVFKTASSQLPTEDASFRLATLKGAIRRLCFQEEEDFEEKEYTAAIHQVVLVSSSSSPFPWTLRVKLWETLLNSLFEAYEDDDVYIDEDSALRFIFLEKLAPNFKISVPLHEACYAWVHFKQLTLTLFPGLIPVLKPLLTNLQEQDQEIDKQDLFYISEVSRICFQTLKETLMDYHEKLGNPELMSGIVELFLILSKTVKGPGLQECIQCSCTRAFQRLLRRINNEPNSATRLRKLAELTRELHEEELLKYTGSLAHYCPSAAALAAKAFHISYGQELNPVLYELQSIPNEVVNMLKSADLLEGALMREISQDKVVSPTVSPWNVMEAISDLLGTWVEAQLKKIRDWQERLLEKETWQPQSDLNPLAASALEFKRLLEESITLVLSMDLYFPAKLVRSFVSGVTGFIQSYAQSILRDIGGFKGVQLLIPPVPTPTRYKKDLADSAAMKEIRADNGKPIKKHSRFKSIVKDPDIIKIVPLIEDSENYPWFNNLKMNTLIVRINSLHFLQQSIPGFKETLNDSFGIHPTDPTDPTDLRDDPFQRASEEVDHCIEGFCYFLGMKLVFWDGRLPWLEQLYRHHVSSSRIDCLLQDIHKSLLDINLLALEDIRNRIASSFLEACVQGLKRVLLDGGPYRLFKTIVDGNDRELIEVDVKRMKDLFYDDEEGLPFDVIEDKTKPLFEILLKMSLPTEDLIKLAEDAKRLATPDFDIYCKILGHRVDHSASKWLKKSLKWPKKIKSKP